MSNWWDSGGFDLIGGLGSKAIEGAVAYEQISNQTGASAQGQKSTAETVEKEQVVRQEAPRPATNQTTLLLMGGGLVAALGLFLVMK